MYQNINCSQFHDAFDRMDRKENFSYEGLNALFDYLEEYEESTGERIELDVIALCCDYTEYSDWDEFTSNYTKYEGMTFDEGIEKLQEETQVIMLEQEGFIIQDF